MRCVIYSEDREFVSTFQAALTGLKLEPKQVDAPAELLHLCSEETLDLVIVDADSGSNAVEMVPIIKRESANRQGVLFAASANVPTESLIAFGASVALKKPVTLEIARRHLRDVLMVTDGERRQYYRLPVSGPMSLHSRSDGKIEGQLVNIGEGGLALKLTRPAKERGDVEIIFRLPGESNEFQVPGKITWADPLGNVGIRFGALEPTTRYRITDWITNAEKAASVTA